MRPNDENETSQIETPLIHVSVAFAFGEEGGGVGIRHFGGGGGGEYHSLTNILQRNIIVSFPPLAANGKDTSYETTEIKKIHKRCVLIQCPLTQTESCPDNL